MDIVRRKLMLVSIGTYRVNIVPLSIPSPYPLSHVPQVCSYAGHKRLYLNTVSQFDSEITGFKDLVSDS